MHILFQILLLVVGFVCRICNTQIINCCRSEDVMSLFSVFTLLGGLAFFIYGMNQMSHSLERIAGSKMERIINKMTKNLL